MIESESSTFFPEIVVVTVTPVGSHMTVAEVTFVLNPIVDVSGFQRFVVQRLLEVVWASGAAATLIVRVATVIFPAVSIDTLFGLFKLISVAFCVPLVFDLFVVKKSPHLWYQSEIRLL